MNKKLKNRIEELEQNNRFLSDNLLDAIWVVDAETLKYEYITPSIERISGYTADEYLNVTVRDMLTPESFQKVLTILLEQMKGYVDELVTMVGGAKNNGDASAVHGMQKIETHQVHQVLPARTRTKTKEVAAHQTRETEPQKVIPMEEDDFNDF